MYLPLSILFKRYGLITNSAFSGVYLGKNIYKTKRYVPLNSELITLNSTCKNPEDERW
jgi:hypothetical protein